MDRYSTTRYEPENRIEDDPDAARRNVDNPATCLMPIKTQPRVDLAVMARLPSPAFGDARLWLSEARHHAPPD
jgi:hypothetical protein